MLFCIKKVISIAGQSVSVVLHMYEQHIFSLQIWMFVTQVHVKILELATTLVQGSLCACVLQFSGESYAKVRCLR